MPQLDERQIAAQEAADRISAIPPEQLGSPALWAALNRGSANTIEPSDPVVRATLALKQYEGIDLFDSRNASVLQEAQAKVRQVTGNQGVVLQETPVTTQDQFIAKWGNRLSEVENGPIETWKRYQRDEAAWKPKEGFIAGVGRAVGGLLSTAYTASTDLYLHAMELGTFGLAKKSFDERKAAGEMSKGNILEVAAAGASNMVNSLGQVTDVIGTNAAQAVTTGDTDAAIGRAYYFRTQRRQSFDEMVNNYFEVKPETAAIVGALIPIPGAQGAALAGAGAAGALATGALRMGRVESAAQRMAKLGAYVSQRVPSAAHTLTSDALASIELGLGKLEAKAAAGVKLTDAEVALSDMLKAQAGSLRTGMDLIEKDMQRSMLNPAAWKFDPSHWQGTRYEGAAQMWNNMMSSPGNTAERLYNLPYVKATVDDFAKFAGNVDLAKSTVTYGIMEKYVGGLMQKAGAAALGNSYLPGLGAVAGAMIRTSPEVSAFTARAAQALASGATRGAKFVGRTVVEPALIGGAVGELVGDPLRTGVDNFMAGALGGIFGRAVVGPLGSEKMKQILATRDRVLATDARAASLRQQAAFDANVKAPAGPGATVSGAGLPGRGASEASQQAAFDANVKAPTAESQPVSGAGLPPQDTFNAPSKAPAGPSSPISGEGLPDLTPAKAAAIAEDVQALRTHGMTTEEAMTILRAPSKDAAAAVVREIQMQKGMKPAEGAAMDAMLEGVTTGTLGQKIQNLEQLKAAIESGKASSAVGDTEAIMRAMAEPGSVLEVVDGKLIKTSKDAPTNNPRTFVKTPIRTTADLNEYLAPRTEAPGIHRITDTTDKASASKSNAEFYTTMGHSSKTLVDKGYRQAIDPVDGARYVVASGAALPKNLAAYDDAFKALTGVEDKFLKGKDLVPDLRKAKEAGTPKISVNAAREVATGEALKALGVESKVRKATRAKGKPAPKAAPAAEAAPVSPAEDPNFGA